MKSVALTIEDRSPHGIASAISRLITTGDLAPGDRLPTVRELAEDLGVSPRPSATPGRPSPRAASSPPAGAPGSFVRSAPREWMPRRYQGLDGSLEAALDLSRGTPDPALLPRLVPMFAALELHADTVSYQAKPDIPQLHDLLRSTWPSPPESLTVTNGALDAIDRVLATLVRYGDRVLVENPTFPPFLDLLEAYGLDPVGVEMDADGMLPDAFAAPSARHPPSCCCKPGRTIRPALRSRRSGPSTSDGSMLRSRNAPHAIAIEDDHSGAISSAPDVTLASVIPERVVHIR